MSISTLTELFFRAASHNKPDCLLHKVGGTYHPVSTAELVDRVRRLSKGLAGIGVVPGDRVALMAENGPHWPTVDFATLTSGAVLVPIYPTLLPDQAAYIANDCGAKVVIAETRNHLDGLLSQAGELPQVQHFVLIKGQSDDPRVVTLDQLIERGAGVDIAAFEARARAVKPDDLATFIYTSGTTGQPKGVMLTHRNLASNVSASIPAIEIKPEFTALSFLPLSHSFERTVDYIYFYNGCTIAYAESVAAVAQNIRETRPHVFVSVPRVYEKILANFHDTVAKGPPVKQKIAAWAQGVGREALPYPPQAPAPARSPRRQARPGRQAGLLQGPREAGGPLHLRRLRWRAPRPGSGGVLLGRRPADLRGLRAVGDLAGDLGQHPRCGQDGNGRQAGRPGRGEDRRGRRDPRPRTEHHEGVLEPARGDRRGDRPGRLVPHRRHRRARRRALPPHHRPQEGADHKRLRQEHRPGADRELLEDQPLHRPGGGDRRPAEVPLRPPGARLRGAQVLGPEERHRRRGCAGAPRQPPGARPLRGRGAGGQQGARPLRADQRLGAPPRRLHPGDRRAHPDPEGQAPGGLQEVRRRHRPALRARRVGPGKGTGA